MSLKKTIEWATKLRAQLQPILEAHGDRVHFRPSSTGVAMVGLLPERPQRGKSGLRDLARVAADFEALFAAQCKDVDHGRVTGEKKLQSWLIRDAYTHGRKLDAINMASAKTDEPVFPGSRLAVRHIGQIAERGESTEDILEDYPYLTPSDVSFARMFARAYPCVGRPRASRQAPTR